MDMKKIGEFLAALRHERGLTQEQLGLALGVTNKTVSRWENGNYLPPVEMLQELSKFYGISINEILSGEYLTQETYQEKAEENIRSALQSNFTLEEKIAWYKDKWRKDHRSSLSGGIVLFVVLQFLGFFSDSMVLQLISVVFAFFFAVIRYNAMMIYVENHAFDPVVEQQPNVDRESLRWRRILLISRSTLAVAVFACVDLACNFLSSLVPEINDGLTVRGILAPLVYGLDGSYWSLAEFYEGFAVSLWLLCAAAVGNIILSCIHRSTQK